MTHSPEPWTLKPPPEKNGDDLYVVEDRDDKKVFDAIRYYPDPPNPENAARIVACVNACEGVPTDDLPKMSDNWRKWRSIQSHFEKRDKVLADKQSEIERIEDRYPLAVGFIKRMVDETVRHKPATGVKVALVASPDPLASELIWINISQAAQDTGVKTSLTDFVYAAAHPPGETPSITCSKCGEPLICSRTDVEITRKDIPHVTEYICHKCLPAVKDEPQTEKGRESEFFFPEQ